MRLAALKALSDEELTIEVGKARGWVRKPCECGHAMCTRYPRWHLDKDIVDVLPGYATDLNEMANALQWLTYEKGMFADWHTCLAIVLHADGKSSSDGNMINASARHRAEAFVFVLTETESVWHRDECDVIDARRKANPMFAKGPV